MRCPNCDALMDEDIEEGVWRCPDCDYTEDRGYSLADVAKMQIAPPTPKLCVFCEEPLLDDVSPNAIGTAEGPRYGHWQCGLRSVMGGIGHLIAHEYWCTQQGDPDAGLTYRQSALLTSAWVAVVQA